MRTRNLIILLSFILYAASVCAQVQIDVKIDSVQLLVGEQTNITLKVTTDAGKKVSFPELKAGIELVPNLEIVDVQSVDTNYLNEGKRMELIQQYTVTAWDSSLYYLPPFKVAVENQVDSSKSLALKVYTLDVDTLHLDQFYPPRGVMEPPFDWNDWRNLVYASFALIIMVIMAYFLFDSARRGKPIVRIIRRKKKLPPHQVAIEEIERIKADRKWAEEDSKEYYTLLTDTLRNYIHERYHFNAMEMTSTQIIEQLLNEDNPECLDELREIFTTADLVKFAKYSTLINENDANLMAAIEYINQTKIEVDPNLKPEPEIIKETDKRRLNQVVAMRIVSVILLTVSVTLLCWIVWKSMDILM